MAERKIKWTEQQKLAIKARGGDILVTASAGTGKTAVLSGRCVNIVRNKSICPDVRNILVLTFTEAAAEQMRSRITEQLQEIFKDLRFSVRVEVDGDISETNATYVDGSEITIFEMDFKKILENPEKFNEFKEKQPDTFEEMRALLEETPGFKVELEERIEISFD